MEERPLGDAGPARAAHGRARVPDLLDRRGVPAHARSARGLVASATARHERARSRGGAELNGARERVGLPPLPYTHGGISRDLALVATFPQLEYPRAEPLAWHDG